MSELVTVSSLLVRINLRLVHLRRALGHRHDDEPWWQQGGLTARAAQGERAILRQVANLLHVERAHRRGRIHGAFTSLEDQHAWLASMERRTCSRAALYAGVPPTTTLASLRAGIAREEVAA